MPLMACVPGVWSRPRRGRPRALRGSNVASRAGARVTVAEMAIGRLEKAIACSGLITCRPFSGAGLRRAHRASADSASWRRHRGGNVTGVPEAFAEGLAAVRPSGRMIAHRQRQSGTRRFRSTLVPSRVVACPSERPCVTRRSISATRLHSSRSPQRSRGTTSSIRTSPCRTPHPHWRRRRPE